ncbi:hypothetical protein ACJJTC_015266 [Scirpophaga incertulas]
MENDKVNSPNKRRLSESNTSAESSNSSDEESGGSVKSELPPKKRAPHVSDLKLEFLFQQVNFLTSLNRQSQVNHHNVSDKSKPSSAVMSEVKRFESPNNKDYPLYLLDRCFAAMTNAMLIQKEELRKNLQDLINWSGDKETEITPSYLLKKLNKPVPCIGRHEDRTAPARCSQYDLGCLADTRWADMIQTWTEQERSLLLTSWRESTMRTYVPTWNKWKNLCGWIKAVLREAGIEASPGSVRSAVSSLNWLENYPIEKILTTGNWRQEHTF